VTKAFLVYPGFDVDEEWNKELHDFHRQVVGHNVAVLTGTLYVKGDRDIRASCPPADARRMPSLNPFLFVKMLDDPTLAEVRN
jgi:hypothetical protein